MVYIYVTLYLVQMNYDEYSRAQLSFPSSSFKAHSSKMYKPLVNNPFPSSLQYLSFLDYLDHIRLRNFLPPKWGESVTTPPTRTQLFVWQGLHSPVKRLNLYQLDFLGMENLSIRKVFWSVIHFFCPSNFNWDKSGYRKTFFIRNVWEIRGYG